MNAKTGLVYTTSKTLGKKRVDVNIRLNDECGNGHCDFAITGEVYEKSRNGRWDDVCAGCCHEEILKFFPEFKDFVDLHLSDEHGRPMYAVENGMYLLKTKGPGVLEEYLRLLEHTGEKFKDVDKDYFTYLLQELGIIDKWEEEAKAAIAHLEQLTGRKFEYPYEFKPLLSQETIDLVKERLSKGYYTPEAIAERKEAERLRKRNAIIERYDKEIKNAKFNKMIDLALFDWFGSTENVVYYDHSQTLKFNYKDPTWCLGKIWTEKEVREFAKEKGAEIVSHISIGNKPIC